MFKSIVAATSLNIVRSHRAHTALKLSLVSQRSFQSLQRSHQSLVQLYRPGLKQLSQDCLTMKQPRHIARGEGPCPPLVPGSLRCYNMKYCPYAHRTLLALVHKGVTFDLVNVSLMHKPSWLLAMTPSAKVPILQRADGTVLGESLVTMCYLDETYKGNDLLPSDPWQKAQHKVVVDDFSSTVIDTMHRFYYANPDQEKSEKMFKKITDGLDVLEAFLVAQRSTYFGGENLGYVDLSIWPWFERLPMFCELTTLNPLTERHPTLLAWLSRMQQHPTVRTLLIPTPEHITFLTSLVSGSPDYNFNIQGQLNKL